MKRATASSSGFLSPRILSAVTLTLAGVLTFAGSSPRNISQSPTPPLLNNVVSRMNHGSAGPFDIDLPGVECRSGGDAGNYQLVFTFKNNLTVVGSSSLAGNCGSIVSGLIGPNSNQYTVNLTALCNEQFLTVTLQDVQDSQGSSGTASSTIGFLLGDTNGDGAVSASDIAQIKAQSGQPATAASFRDDVNASGSITAADVAQTKSGSGTAITTEYVEDFEDGIANGFTLTGLWHVTQNYPNAGSNSLGFVQAETASSIPNGNYNTGSNLTQTIFSGPILITGTNPTLTFRAFVGDEWDQGPEGWDRLSASISTD